MAKNICVSCHRLYNTDKVTYEQRIISDEDFCPICWEREIMAFADEVSDFSFLEGLLQQ
jgi:RNA polymerase subunit RPABC4/transcription elongation factor Spt4